MGIFRRLLGGDRQDASDVPEPAGSDPTAVDDDERAYERELLEAEDARLDDLAKRQLRYARYAWQPPAQGGERRADDHDAGR
jgi:hypothetical protein